jgi:D-alanyl-D-alanine carboxypeptidase/D-alanyl-D-alanine-endopeptidase (penicillin-binding protein 4)
MRSRSLPLALLLLSLAGTAGADEDPVSALLLEKSLRGAQIGVAVSDLEAGSTLFESRADRSLIPASNQKLLIAAAALEHWGPTHRFETPVFIDGDLDEKGVLDGSLWIEGSGDPSLVSESLWKLAEEIRLAGIREIRGGIAVDSSYFDAQRFHPDWEPVSARAYHAPIGAFAVNYSSFRIEVRAAETLGRPAVVSIAPRTAYLHVDSRVRTEARSGPLKIGVDTLPSGLGDRVQVHGVVAPNGEGKTYWRAVTQPEGYAASMLRTQLQAQGIAVAGPTRSGRVPPSARELLRFQGESVAILVQRLSKFSNNFVAEQLTKLLGAAEAGPPGTWEKGAAAISRWVETSGLPYRDVTVRDGSGLSARNRVSARALVGLLARVSERFEWGPEFLAALPLGGLDGTLEDRLNGEPIPLRAKTGHLRRVSSLSGYVETLDGRRLAFAVLINGARGAALDVDAALDRFVTRLSQLRIEPPTDATALEPTQTNQGATRPEEQAPQ